MPVGRLIGGLKIAPLVWGRCFSVVAADLEYAFDALEDISPGLDPNTLREIEAMHSARMRDRNLLLSGNPRNQPVGPFSSVLLEALSIRCQRDVLDEKLLGGWLCHSSEDDAITAARTRFGSFCSASAANELSAGFQVYSARVAGRFSRESDVLALLASGKSANDPQRIADIMIELRAAEIDGIVLGQDDQATSALVLRGRAVSQIRQARRIEIRSEGGSLSVAGDSMADRDNWSRMCHADPGASE